MASRDGQGADRGRDQESELVFAQRKLEDNYGKIYRQLNQWRGALETIQEVLAWKRPVPAALLYLAVHWLFYYLANNNEGFLSRVSSLLFWVLVGDAIWRAATKDGQGLGPDSSRSGARVVRKTRQREVSDVVSFERALLLTYEQRRCHQLVPYEVVCLTVAKWWMELDNLWLAMRHWSTHDPIMFCMSLAVPGLILAVIGKYIPTLVLLYILVMGVIVWPYIQYQDLLQRAADFIATHFPVVIRRAESWWQLMKTLFTRDESAVREFSLVGDGDATQTQELLGDEFDQIIAPPRQREVEESSEVGRQERGREGIRATPGRRVDPGMSVLQDSVLGMTADAFHDVEDSLASFGPGTGEFPSISNFDDHDHSLLFPPESVNQQSISPHLATIQESEEDVLDDSVELEYGLNQQTVLRHRSASYHEPRPQKTHTPVEYSISAPITDPPHYPMEMKGESFGRRSPPPSYDAVVAQDTVYQTIYPNLEEELSHQQRMPKSSSTPLPDGHQ